MGENSLSVIFRAIPRFCFIIHVYVFELTLLLTLLHCAETSTADIETATIASVVPKKEANR